MQHALTALRAELAVLQDVRRALIHRTAGDMTEAQRQALLEAGAREIAEVAEGLGVLVAYPQRSRRAA